MRSRIILLSTAVLTATMLFPLIGCGGGGGSTPPPPADLRTRVTQSAVRTARGAADAFTDATRAVEASPNRGRETTRAAGKVSRHGVDSHVEGVEYDADFGLHYRSTLDSNRGTYRLDYYSNREGTGSPTGYLETILEGEWETYPFSLKMDFDVPNGLRAERGQYTFRMDSAESGRLTGNIFDYLTGDQQTFDLNFGADGALTGGFQLTPGTPRSGHQGTDLPIAYQNLNVTPEGKVTAHVVIGSEGAQGSGPLTVNPDRAGSLELDTTEGKLKANWNAVGQGTVTYPDGSTRTIADFDSVSG